MCIYICILFIYIYIYTVHTDILCKLKSLFWMRLIKINCLTALVFYYVLLTFFINLYIALFYSGFSHFSTYNYLSCI